MNINGLQKLTLLDYPGKTACTVFLAGCNLRCPFCHNAPLVLSPDRCESITQEELFAFLKKRAGVLDGVCISGGEPLLREDTGELIRGIHELGYKVKLDTNGTFPERLRELTESGDVDYVAMDIKNSPESYARTVGAENFDIAPVMKSAELLMKGNIPFEFRTTLVKGLHTVRDIESIGRWLGGDEAYFLQGYKDSGNLISGRFVAFNENEYNVLLKTAKRYFPNVRLRGI